MVCHNYIDAPQRRRLPHEHPLFYFPDNFYLLNNKQNSRLPS